jgi:hypothetical protein
LLGSILDTVATKRRQCTIMVARAVRAIVDAVVARLAGILDSVPTLEVAATVARITPGPVEGAVITLLTAVDLAVATGHRRRIVSGAIGLARAWRCIAVGSTIVTLFAK